MTKFSLFVSNTVTSKLIHMRYQKFQILHITSKIEKVVQIRVKCYKISKESTCTTGFSSSIIFLTESFPSSAIFPSSLTSSSSFSPSSSFKFPVGSNSASEQGLSTITPPSLSLTALSEQN
ncbi:hypothetical protein ABFS82_02G098800 [Erythranthe guttata]